MTSPTLNLKIVPLQPLDPQQHSQHTPSFKLCIVRTLVLNSTSLCMGLWEGLKGPTMLDLTKELNTTVEEISYMFLFYSCGSVVGSLIIGNLYDHYRRYKFLVLFLIGIVFTTSSCLYPYAGNVRILYILALISGAGCGALNTGINVGILDIWKDNEFWKGLGMHGLHFSVALGSLISPLVSFPFIGGNNDNTLHIKTLYLIVGISTGIIMCLLFIVYLHQLKKKRSKRKFLWSYEMKHPTVIKSMMKTVATCPIPWSEMVSNENQEDEEREDEEDKLKLPTASYRARLIIAMSSVFFFLYVGMEETFGSYVATFAVECKLHLTEMEGAKVTAFFWLSFSATRFISIFTTLTFQPSAAMLISFTSCVAGSTLGIFIAEMSMEALIGICILMGSGLATIFATGLLWLEQYIVITNRNGAILCIASSIGTDVFPVLVGNFIEREPMVLIYTVASITALCIIIFTLMNAVVTLKKRKTKEQRRREQELMKIQEQIAMKMGQKINKKKKSKKKKKKKKVQKQPKEKSNIKNLEEPKNLDEVLKKEEKSKESDNVLKKEEKPKESDNVLKKKEKPKESDNVSKKEEKPKESDNVSKKKEKPKKLVNVSEEEEEEKSKKKWTKPTTEVRPKAVKKVLKNKEI